MGTLTHDLRVLDRRRYRLEDIQAEIHEASAPPQGRTAQIQLPEGMSDGEFRTVIQIGQAVLATVQQAHMAIVYPEFIPHPQDPNQKAIQPRLSRVLLSSERDAERLLEPGHPMSGFRRPRP